MYDSSAGGSGGRETTRGRSYEQKRRNINSSSQFTITYSSRFTVFLSYCVNEKRRCRGGKATFPKLSARIWVWIPTLSSVPQGGRAFKKCMVSLVCTMANWNTRCMLREVISPKMARPQKQTNVKALNKKLNYPVMFTSCSGQEAMMVRVVHARGKLAHPQTLNNSSLNCTSRRKISKEEPNCVKRC